MLKAVPGARMSSGAYRRRGSDPGGARAGVLRCRKPPPADVKADALVISGGGIKGVAALGAVYALQRRGELSDVKLMVGTSAGALVCAALACGRDPVAIARQMGPKSFKPDFDLGALAQAFGVDTGRGLTSLIDTILGGRYTFGQLLAERGVRLVVCVTNVTARRPEYLGPDTHPHMDVALALRMSCAVPLYFAAVRLGDAMYVDGVLTDNFPCEWALANGARQVLGIKFVTRQGPVTSLDAYVSALVQCALWRHNPRQQPDSRNVRLFEIDTEHTSSVNFNMQKAHARKLFRLGADQARLWLKKRV